MEYILFFSHKNGKDRACLSQWYPSVFVVDGVTYCCAEQYMMHQKALFFKDFQAAERIMNTFSPNIMRNIGRCVKGFNPKEWDRVKMNIVFKGNYNKFAQNEPLKRYLLSTGDAILAEASPQDREWGIGLSAIDRRAYNMATWNGKNLLGKVLMLVREDLKNEGNKPVRETTISPVRRSAAVKPNPLINTLQKEKPLTEEEMEQAMEEIEYIEDLLEEEGFFEDFDLDNDDEEEMDEKAWQIIKRNKFRPAPPVVDDDEDDEMEERPRQTIKRNQFRPAPPVVDEDDPIKPYVPTAVVKTIDAELIKSSKPVRAMFRYELAAYAGVSPSTFGKWIKENLDELRAAGYDPHEKLLPPRVVMLLCKKFGINLNKDKE